VGRNDEATIGVLRVVNHKRGPGHEPDDSDGVGRVGDEAGAEDLEQFPGVAEIVAALRAAPTAEELKAEHAYRQLFDTVNAQPQRHWQAARRPHGRCDRTVVVGTRAALVTAVAVVAIGATAAAYAGALPVRLQQSAHRFIGAPAPHADKRVPVASEATSAPTARPTPTATHRQTNSQFASPSAVAGTSTTDAAAHGWCTAWSKGGLSANSNAYRQLTTAAGGKSLIAAYCAPILSPNSPAPDGKSSAHSHGPKPTKIHPDKKSVLQDHPADKANKGGRPKG
jgi:hypothetical protein